MNKILETMNTKFKELFGNNGNDPDYFFAPGRVNLIGEHTDYNGGYVFPCALDIGTYAIVRPNTTSVCRLHSLNFIDYGVIEFDLEDLQFKPEHSWANYPKGIMVEFIKAGINLTNGFDLLIFGNIPNGAGLSSSASIETLTATILNHYAKIVFDPIKLALIGQAAENNYIGVGCGVMDQFASAMGKESTAILLDCNTLKYEYVPLNLGDYRLVIANTCKRRGLADSKYNQRLNECQQALKILQSQFEIKSLCSITSSRLNFYRYLFQDQVMFKRALHAVSENERTLSAVSALQKDDLAAFGQLMNQSHVSLRDNYDVTGKELDTLVAHAWEHSGCIGARMTGAGMGGCTVNLVQKDAIGDFINTVGDKYFHRINLKPEFYLVNPSRGAHKITLDR